MNKHIGVILIIGLLSLSSIIVNTACGDSIELTSTGITLYVGGSGPGNYSTIKSAINAAQDGDTVFVYDDSSPYYENNLNIWYSIELIGENKYTTIIDSGSILGAIYIYSGSVKVKGFTIQNGYTGISTGTNSHNIEISDNIIKLNNYGNYCSYGSNVTIRDNIISSNNVGISLNQISGTNVVESNIIESNKNIAIIFWGAITIDVKYNNIVNNGYFSPSPFFQAKFDDGMVSRQNWNGNYWGRPLLFPMPIFGIRISGCAAPPDILNLMIRWDRRPALKPYDIG